MSAIQKQSEEPLARESLSNQAYFRLRRDIMSGRFLPGEKLKLRDLAAELGVSPTPVREALARLVADMAVVQLDHRSVRIPHIDPERFSEICILRIDVEGRAAARAAELATVEQVSELEAIHDSMIALKKTRDFKESFAENQRFHAAFCALADMPLHYRIAETLWLQIGPLMNGLMIHRPTTLPQRHPHHTLLEGLRTRNPELAREGAEMDIRINAEPMLAYLRNSGAAESDAQP